MALALDAQTSSTVASFTHTPVGTPRGVVVMIVQNASTTDAVTAVTYGGVAMSRVATAFASGETGRTYVYFLGSGVPTGAQSVAVTGSAGTSHYWALSFTAASDVEVAASNTLQSASSTNPQVTLATTSTYTGMAVGAIFSGLSAPSGLTAATGYTKTSGERDFGAQCATAQYGTKSGASVTFGFTAAADDVAMVAAALRELGSAVPMLVTAPYLPQGWNQ